jgi:NhaP-type Na+/H+ or K+/H+ antiporter
MPAIVSMLLSLVFLLVFLGLVYWLITKLPLPEPFLPIIQVVMVLILLALVWAVFTGWAPAWPLAMGRRG